MHFKLISFFLLICASPIFAQTVGGIKAGGIDANPAPGGIVQEIDLSVPITIGNVYLSDSWHVGSLYFYGHQKILNMPLKYDVENGMIEINFSDKVKTVKDIWIKKMSWTNPSSGAKEMFINGKDLTINGTPLTGLYKFIDLHGEYSLLLRYSVTYSNGTYVAALDAGNGENKISVNSRPYLLIDGGAIELPKKRKDFFVVFGKDNEDLIRNYVKKESLKTNKFEDILQIVNYLNSCI